MRRCLYRICVLTVIQNRRVICRPPNIDIKLAQVGYCSTPHAHTENTAQVSQHIRYEVDAAQRSTTFNNVTILIHLALCFATTGHSRLVGYHVSMITYNPNVADTKHLPIVSSTTPQLTTSTNKLCLAKFGGAHCSIVLEQNVGWCRTVQVAQCFYPSAYVTEQPWPAICLLSSQI